MLSTNFCAETIINGFKAKGLKVDFYIHRPQSHLYMVPDYIFPQSKLLKKIKDKWSLSFYTNLINKLGEEYGIILIIAPFQLPFYFLESLRKKIPHAKMLCYFWDDVEVASGSLERVGYFDKIFSYNKCDCDKYNFTFRPFFLTSESNIPVPERKYDVLHVGSFSPQHLKRYDIIRKFTKSNRFLNNYIYLKALNFLVSFICFVKGQISIVDIFKFKYSRLEWDKMIQLLKESKAVLDIPRDGQIGLTTIVLQALGTGTKIITTDESIKNYSFYDSSMIRVITIDNLKIDKSWINSPLTRFENIDDYKLDSFISDFLN